MKKVIKIKEKQPMEGIPYKGMLFTALYFVEGEVDFLDYDCPHMAVFVVKEGTRFLNVGGVDGELDLGWVKFKGTEIPNWEEYPLPVYNGIVLDDRVVLLRTRITLNRVCVVSQRAWETQWEEVSTYLRVEGVASILKTWPAPEEISLTLGGDPEFEVVLDGEIVPAVDISIFSDGDLEGPIGTDGAAHTAELRPDAACSPEEYVGNFMALVDRVSEEGILLSVKGDTYPLGGHIHVGSPNDNVVQALQDEVEHFVQVLDDFVGSVLLPTSGKARGAYACLGTYELKSYGWEYRTPPASIYADPEMVRITYKLTKGLVEALLVEREISYETLEDGRVKDKEYYRFLTKEEAEYFLDFPRKWAKGEISSFVPVRNPAVLVAAG
jgi:hypothetical protein